MLKPPKVGGAGQLRLFVQELGFEWACQVLEIHPSTMRGWLREARPVPQAAMQALYWLTSWGFSDACSEAHWSHQFMLYKVRQLEERIEAMKARSSLTAFLDAVDPVVGLAGSRGGFLGFCDRLGKVSLDGGVHRGAGTDDGQDLENGVVEGHAATPFFLS
jgi:hypothetical protein